MGKCSVTFREDACGCVHKHVAYDATDLGWTQYHMCKEHTEMLSRVT